MLLHGHVDIDHHAPRARKYVAPAIPSQLGLAAANTSATDDASPSRVMMSSHYHQILFIFFDHRPPFRCRAMSLAVAVVTPGFGTQKRCWRQIRDSNFIVLGRHLE
jgi:hypothetical protein